MASGTEMVLRAATNHRKEEEEGGEKDSRASKQLAFPERIGSSRDPSACTESPIPNHDS